MKGGGHQGLWTVFKMPSHSLLALQRRAVGSFFASELEIIVRDP